MIQAQIVAHSLNPQGDELISVLCTFPRIILAEVNTHRMLSKNTSSSRAIPFEKMKQSIKDNPFIPIAWQKHHKGMQGKEYITGELELRSAKHAWELGMEQALTNATRLYNAGVTKQICNRLLEPYMWTTMLITGPREGWDNFFELRCPVYEDKITGRKVKSRKEISSLNEYGEYPKYFDDTLGWLQINQGQAEIHMMALAEQIYDAVNESTSVKLEAGEWHIPFADKIDDFKIKSLDYDNSSKERSDFHNVDIDEYKVKISTAMAAHTSYTVVGGEVVKSYEDWIGLHDRLLGQDPPHSSPMEHCAKTMDNLEYYSHIKGKVYTNYDDEGSIFNSEYFPYIDEEDDESSFPFKGANPHNFNKFGWCRNFKGFIPYRHIIESK